MATTICANHFGFEEHQSPSRCPVVCLTQYHYGQVVFWMGRAKNSPIQGMGRIVGMDTDANAGTLRRWIVEMAVEDAVHLFEGGFVCRSFYAWELRPFIT